MCSRIRQRISILSLLGLLMALVLSCKAAPTVATPTSTPTVPVGIRTYTSEEANMSIQYPELSLIQTLSGEAKRDWQVGCLDQEIVVYYGCLSREGIEFTTGGAEDRMGEEDTLLAVKEALAYLRRIERLLETLAENMREYLESSRQLLASPALKADVARVQDSRVTYFADQAQSQTLTIREVTINPAEHIVTLRDQPIELTPTEFDILFCLMRNGGRVLSCQELVRQAQGYELDERDARYLIRPHLTRLRQKLVTEAGDPEYIHNVRGVGYYFERRTRQRD